MDKRGFRCPLGLVAAILAGNLAACTWVAWHGHGPDRRVRVVVQQRSGRQFVVRDNVPEPSFDGIAIEGIAFSDDGRHLAYPARRGGRWCVVTDAALGPFWDGIGFVRFGPRSATPTYAALRDSKWIVVNGVSEGPALDAILAESVTFSRDGRHLAYAGRISGVTHVVTDGIAEAGYHGVAALNFSADSKHRIYVGRTGSQVHVVKDGQEGEPHDEILEPRLSPSGGRLAYAARDGGVWRVFTDGKQGPDFDAVESLTFDPSGRSLAYVGVSGSGAAVVRDGQKGEAFDEIITGSLVFSSDGRDLAFAAARGGRMVAVLNGSAGPWSESVSKLAFNPCDGAFVYVRRDAGSCRWVLNGEQGPVWTWLGEGVFGPGCRFGFIGRNESGMKIVIDGRTSPVDLAVDGSLVFSDDGKHWACLAGNTKIKKLFIIVDSPSVQRPFDWDEMAGEILRHPEGSLGLAEAAEKLRRWVKAELELAFAVGDRDKTERDSPVWSGTPRIGNEWPL